MLNAAEIVARAEAFAAAHRAARHPQPGRLSKTGPTDSADAVRRKMADDMLDIAAVKECAETEDLLGRGWTLEAIRKHGEAARDLANAARERKL